MAWLGFLKLSGGPILNPRPVNLSQSTSPRQFPLLVRPLLVSFLSYETSPRQFPFL